MTVIKFLFFYRLNIFELLSIFFMNFKYHVRQNITLEYKIFLLLENLKNVFILDFMLAKN